LTLAVNTGIILIKFRQSNYHHQRWRLDDIDPGRDLGLSDPAGSRTKVSKVN